MRTLLVAKLTKPLGRPEQAGHCKLGNFSSIRTWAVSHRDSSGAHGIVEVTVRASILSMRPAKRRQLQNRLDKCVGIGVAGQDNQVAILGRLRPGTVSGDERPMEVRYDFLCLCMDVVK